MKPLASNWPSSLPSFAIDSNNTGSFSKLFYLFISFRPHWGQCAFSRGRYSSLLLSFSVVILVIVVGVAAWDFIFSIFIFFGIFCLFSCPRFLPRIAYCLTYKHDSCFLRKLRIFHNWCHLHCFILIGLKIIVIYKVNFILLFVKLIKFKYKVDT